MLSFGKLVPQIISLSCFAGMFASLPEMGTPNTKSERAPERSLSDWTSLMDESLSSVGSFMWPHRNEVVSSFDNSESPVFEKENVAVHSMPNFAASAAQSAQDLESPLSFRKQPNHGAFF